MKKRPQVVIVGGGFAGLSAARGLEKAPVDVLLIDRRNHHLFQPLLYQVATSALAPADVASPIRHLARKQKNLRVFWDEVVGVDQHAKSIETEQHGQIDYDYLVLATGAQHSYFGKDEWAQHAPGLKSIEDAFVLRHRILGAFEKAEMEKDSAKRDAFLEFVVVGAGPTGVEMAGALAELARHSLVRDFRTITPSCARIKLVEAGPRILPTFDSKLSLRAQKSLEALGVEVLTDTRVSDIKDGHVQLNKTFLAAETIIWAAGVQASAASEWLGTEKDRSGRVVVDQHLRLADNDSVFVIGDTAAHTPSSDERPLPGLAPVAKQMGAYVAKLISAETRGKAAPKAFKYRDWGIMATIGRNKAIVQMGGFRASGFLAWAIWSLVHVAFLEGSQNRISVGLSWIWSYLTWQRGARLIIGTNGKSADGSA